MRIERSIMIIKELDHWIPKIQDEDRRDQLWLPKNWMTGYPKLVLGYWIMFDHNLFRLSNILKVTDLRWLSKNWMTGYPKLVLGYWIMSDHNLFRLSNISKVTHLRQQSQNFPKIPCFSAPKIIWDRDWRLILKSFKHNATCEKI